MTAGKPSFLEVILLFLADRFLEPLEHLQQRARDGRSYYRRSLYKTEVRRTKAEGKNQRISEAEHLTGRASPLALCSFDLLRRRPHNRAWRAKSETPLW